MPSGFDAHRIELNIWSAALAEQIVVDLSREASDLVLGFEATAAEEHQAEGHHKERPANRRLFRVVLDLLLSARDSTTADVTGRAFPSAVTGAVEIRHVVGGVPAVEVQITVHAAARLARVAAVYVPAPAFLGLVIEAQR